MLVEVCYIFFKYCFIKVESVVGGGVGDFLGGVCVGGCIWSLMVCGGKKLFNKCVVLVVEESGVGKKDKVIIVDDYLDFFDVKNDFKSKVGKGESVGYMEFYEV